MGTKRPIKIIRQLYVGGEIKSHYETAISEKTATQIRANCVQLHAPNGTEIRQKQSPDGKMKIRIIFKQ